MISALTQCSKCNMQGTDFSNCTMACSFVFASRTPITRCHHSSTSNSSWSSRRCSAAFSLALLTFQSFNSFFTRSACLILPMIVLPSYSMCLGSLRPRNPSLQNHNREFLNGYCCSGVYFSAICYFGHLPCATTTLHW
jgi:hypothetical protein